MNRSELLELSGESYDVIVVGAGINGAGIAQQLAADGYKVLIIDKGDFSGGATSKSSRLLHCGLRYLTPGKSILDFVLHPTKFYLACFNARKAMIARSEISSSMNELVRPFQFFFPIYKDGPYQSWIVDFAFKILNLLGPQDNSLEYQRFSGENLKNIPFNNWFRDSKKLRGISVFKEYQFISAERLVLDTIRNSAKMGATVRNYTFILKQKQIDNIWHLTLKDALNSSEVNVNTKLILNITGPWGNCFNETIKSKVQKKVIGLKGTHIVVKLPEEFSECGIMFINRLNEAMYILPWNDTHYIGLNRTPYDGDLDKVKATKDEIEWLLGEVNYLFPKLNLQNNDVIYSFAGIQPITFDKSDSHGTRKVVLHDMGSEGIANVLMLTGGPIWNYRHVAKNILKEVSKRFAPSLLKKRSNPVSSEVTQLLFKNKSKSVQMKISKNIIKKIILEEQPFSLADILLRRTSLGWNIDQGESAVHMVANSMAEIKGWNEQQKQKEIKLFLQQINEIYQV